VERIAAGQLPINRALKITAHQRLIRELILQLKLGYLEPAYFREKFNVDIASEFSEQFGSLVNDGYATMDNGEIRLTRAGLLRVDALLPRFFEPEHRDIRYT
jgi:oxygen-independent coproporphyrinogen-3 oxidase